MNTWEGRPYLAILGGKEEDRFTQYLDQLLRSSVVLKAFLGEVCGIALPTEDKISSRTQVSVPGGRPDLAIRGDRLYLLFEAKVGSWLHEEQLTPYAHELEQWREAHPTGTACLFILAPQRQMSGLIEMAKRELSENDMNHWCPKAITWEQISVLFQTLEERIEDRRLALHLREFSEIIVYRLGEHPRPFTAEECHLLDDPLVARVFHRTKLLVDMVTNQLSLDGFTLALSRGSFYDGYNVTYNGRYWWYGIWVDVWVKNGLSPIFLQLPGFTNQPVSPIPNGLLPPVRIQSGNEDQVVPLPLRYGVELEVLAHEQAEIIRRYSRELPQSGGKG